MVQKHTYKGKGGKFSLEVTTALIFTAQREAPLFTCACGGGKWGVPAQFLSRV